MKFVSSTDTNRQPGGGQCGDRWQTGREDEGPGDLSIILNREDSEPMTNRNESKSIESVSVNGDREIEYTFEEGGTLNIVH
jgi:hypothetical protein